MRLVTGPFSHTQPPFLDCSASTVSLRLEMLQVARLAPKLLGNESAELIRTFLRAHLDATGAGLDRVGRPDLYYTMFVLAGLEGLQAEWPKACVENYLLGFNDGADLDFIHLGALARCWAAIGCEKMPAGLAENLLARIERHRSADGGYDNEVGARFGSAYGCFVAFGAAQDLRGALPDPLRMVQCLKLLETRDGAWANAHHLPVGSTNATAAAIILLRQLDLPINPAVADWLIARAHPDGGFRAAPSAPLPDLLSTATTLHAFAAMQIDLPEMVRERCLDFVDTLWSATGGFHGHWADDDLDAEYTFYGLLALGHLSL